MSEEITIVIVDDHPMVRQTWKMLLHQYEELVVIGECSSGEEAIEMVPKLLPKVVLMDINMHPVNGMEATKLILKKCPQIRIIGISINDQPSYARHFLHLGASGYITKTSSREEMVQGIKLVVSGGTYISADVQKRMTGDKS
jgi:two-component system, NarL family, invasion response regulator UvrY